MRKAIPIIAVLLITIPMLVSLMPLTRADIGTNINSGWAFTIPTINGSISPGQWTTATVRNFTLDIRDRTVGNHVEYLNGSMLVMNDYNNLYIAVQIYNDTYWATNFANRWKGLAILFNENDNGSLGTGEKGEGITSWTGSPFYSNNDLYYNKSSMTWVSAVSVGLIQDGHMNFTFSNPVQGAYGTWTFTMSIPLVDVNSGHNLQIPRSKMPYEIGYKLWFIDSELGADGVYPDQTSIPISLDQTFKAATYGDIIIYPLYYLTIVAGPGGTTSPAPGVYAYAYGTMVSVTALPSVGYMLDHWILDAVNVGSANPYAVTMNQNHTLQALFKKISAVGGLSLTPTILPSIAGYGMILAAFGAAVVIIRRKKR